MPTTLPSTNSSKESAGYDHLVKRYRVWAPRYDKYWKKYTHATLSKTLESVDWQGVDRVLDVACGTGVLTSMIHKRDARIHVTGIDVSPHMVERATKNYPPDKHAADWAVGFAEKLPLDDQTYDVVTCNNAFHLVQDADRALQEFYRVLRPNGQVVLVDWALDKVTMKAFSGFLKVSDRQRRKILNHNALAGRVEQAGFRLERSEHFNPNWFWGLALILGRK